MRNYEAVFCFQAKEEDYQKGLTFVREQISKNKGKISSEVDMKERALAYPIKNEDRGHYMLFNAELDPQSIDEISKIANIQPEILRYLFVRAE